MTVIKFHRHTDKEIKDAEKSAIEEIDDFGEAFEFFKLHCNNSVLYKGIVTEEIEDYINEKMYAQHFVVRNNNEMLTASTVDALNEKYRKDDD